MALLKLIKSERGVILLSVIWGLGFACLFRKVCNDRDCIEYKAPSMDSIINQIWKFNNKCYKYETEPVKCNLNPIK
jgi:hypothetical protein